MLPGLAAWHRHLLPDGVTFIHPDGLERGGIQVRDRRPLCAVRTLAEDTLRRLPPGLTDGELTAPRRFTTVEGEYAAIATLTARFVADGGRYVRILGAVHGDDSQRQVDAFLARAGDDDLAVLEERVELLVRYACLGLGAHRRRRYLYTPPAGWHGRAHGLHARWFAPGFPRAVATIVVAPAKPVTEDVTVAALERVLAEDGPVAFDAEGEPEVVEISAAAGPSGVLTRSVGAYPGRPRSCLIVAELADHRFIYQALLEATDPFVGMAEPVFVGLVRSIRALPEPIVTTDDGGAMNHWAL